MLAAEVAEAYWNTGGLGGYWILTPAVEAELMETYPVAITTQAAGNRRLFGRPVMVREWGKPYEYIAFCVHCGEAARYAAQCGNCGGPMPGWAD